MSLTTGYPLRMVGGNVNSGNINTGEVPYTRGGMQTACAFSGAIAMGTAAMPTGAIASGGSALITSGGGRLNSFTALFPAGVALAGHGVIGILSGLPIVAYDSVVLARSDHEIFGSLLL